MKILNSENGTISANYDSHIYIFHSATHEHICACINVHLINDVKGLKQLKKYRTYMQTQTVVCNLIVTA